MKLSNQLIGKKIYIRISLGANKQYRVKTPITINSALWNAKTQAPIKYEDDVERLQIKVSLDELHKQIRIYYVRDSINATPINQDWLKSIVDGYFNQEDELTKGLFSSYIQEYINNAAYRDTLNGQGLSIGRIKGIKSFKKMWLRFEEYEKTEYSIKEITTKTITKFTNWLDKKFLLMVQQQLKCSLNGNLFQHILAEEVSQQIFMEKYLHQFL